MNPTTERHNIAKTKLRRKTGGEGGIRTPDTLSGMAAFEAARFNHSRTSPRRSKVTGGGRTVTLHNESATSVAPAVILANEQTCRLLRLRATLPKERLHQFSAASAEHAPSHFHLMVQFRRVQHRHHGMHRAGFGVVRAIDKPPDSSV